MKEIQAIRGHDSITMMTADVYGHLLTWVEDGVELFGKLKEGLIAGTD